MSSDPTRHQVILIPGFFGFGNLGDLNYFEGVKEALEAAFGRTGLSVDIHEVATLPTASIRTRAARVLEAIAETAASGDGPIHIVGHSTGGLDARLAIAPTASLPTKIEFDQYERLKTLVTVCTPHFGTPLADFSGSAAGYPLLRLFAAGVRLALTRGRLPVGLALRVGSWVSKLDDRLGFHQTVADDFFVGLVSDFSPARRAELLAFVEGIAEDQSLVFQLTAAGCDLLNAGTADPKTMRYGSVVCSAQPPKLSNLVAFKHNPYAQATHALYAVSYRLAAAKRNARFPEPVDEQMRVLVKAFGTRPEPSWSDGMVPTLSQVWGDVVHATRADHLDVVGHFGGEVDGKFATDWLPSCSGFDRQGFDLLWNDVARFITAEAKSPKHHPHNVGTERTSHDLPVTPPVQS